MLRIEVAYRNFYPLARSFSEVGKDAEGKKINLILFEAPFCFVNCFCLSSRLYLIYSLWFFSTGFKGLAWLSLAGTGVRERALISQMQKLF